MTPESLAARPTAVLVPEPAPEPAPGLFSRGIITVRSRSLARPTAMGILAILPLLLTMLASPLFAGDITRQSVLDSLNAQRAAQDLPPLHFDSRLDSSADDRMRDMEDLGYWGHESPDGRSPFLWLKQHNYDFSFAGENLASGFETCELLVQSWMESKGHRDNILSPFYTECGMAIIDGSTTGRRAGKSIVILFARPRA